MKKLMTLLLTVVMVLSLVACGQQDGNTSDVGNHDNNTSVTEKQENTSENDKQEGNVIESDVQEDTTSENNENQESTSEDNVVSEIKTVVAPKTPDEPAPLVDRVVEGLTQEQVSEAYKYVYFAIGVPYEEIDEITDANILFYWQDYESLTASGINPYESFDLYFVGSDASEWPTADYITEGVIYNGTGKVVLINKPNTLEKDGYDCWRVFIDRASVDEVAAYIDALKAEGFNYVPSFFGSEEIPAGQFDFLGQYEWQGKAEDGRCIQFLHTEEQTNEFTGDELTQLIINLYSQDPNS